MMQQEQLPKNEQPAQQELPRLQTSVEGAFQGIQHGLSDELVVIRQQLAQIKGLLADAIGSLHDSFSDLNREAQQQMTLMQTLVSGTAYEGDDESAAELNMQRRAELADEALQSLMQSLLASSRESLSAVASVDKMHTDMGQSAIHAQVVKTMLDKISHLAEQDNVDTLRIAHLADVGLAEHEKLIRQMQASGSGFQELHVTLEALASRDMDEVFVSKRKVESIVQSFYCMDRVLEQCRLDIQASNGQMRQHLATVVRALQFEDIISQSLGHTELHLSRMEGFMCRVNDGLRNLGSKEISSLSSFYTEIDLLHGDAMQYLASLRLDDLNPVSQESMDEGEIELF